MKWARHPDHRSLSSAGGFLPCQQVARKTPLTRRLARPNVPAIATTRAYGEVREEFTTGDVLGFRGRGPASALIRWATASRYSHVGLVYRFEGRVYCLEAVGSGVRLIIMSELTRRYPGGIDYFAVPEASAE